MSSWKKAAKTGQKTHRERHQPESRKHLGLLEKKKDYLARSTDYHQKGDTLRLLRKRALDKNPDEFDFHMINSKIEDGMHREKDKAEDYTPEQLKLMETQDINYIAYKRNIEAKKVEKMQSSLHMIDAANASENKHTFFIDEDEDRRSFDLAKRLDTHPDLLSRRTNRPKLSTLKTMQIPDYDDEELAKIEQKKHMAYKELSKRIERERELTTVQQKLEIRRALKDKNSGKPKLVRRGTKESAAIYKWPYERKR